MRAALRLQRYGACTRTGGQFQLAAKSVSQFAALNDVQTKSPVIILQRGIQIWASSRRRP